MKIAIMGAGLSGLACAITLKKLGVEPDIFENRHQVGDRFVNAEAMFNVLNKPINNCLTYIADRYDIHLEPVSHINKIIIHSKNEISTIKGELGISNVRGRHEDSFENQLYGQLDTKVHFNTQATYEDLRKTYDYVVLAPGDGAYAEKLNNYEKGLTVSLKGATVEGDFTPEDVSVWFNHDFVPKGYAYMIPFSKKEANIVIAYPDYPENNAKDIDTLWQHFFKQVNHDLKQKLRVTDSFQIRKYFIGRCHHPKVDQTYFVGNCFGAIGPFLGFGQFSALLTGIHAAYDICGLEDYTKKTKVLWDNYNNSLVLRKGLEKLSDDHLDLLVKNLDNRLLDPLIDRMFGDTSTFDSMKWLSHLLGPFMAKDN